MQLPIQAKPIKRCVSNNQTLIGLLPTALQCLCNVKRQTTGTIQWLVANQSINSDQPRHTQWEDCCNTCKNYQPPVGAKVEFLNMVAVPQTTWADYLPVDPNDIFNCKK